MNYWLIKSEPETYPIDQLRQEKKTQWTGIRNYAARLHLRSMKKNDLCLFYHSGKESAIVGIAKVIKENYLDPSATEGEWSAIDVQYIKGMNKVVSLQDVKKEPYLADMILLKISRLSVQPVTENQFQKILEMGATQL